MKPGKQPSTMNKANYLILPSKELPPAMVGMFHSRGRSVWSVAVATLFDLARRGIIVIEEIPKPWFRLLPRHEFIIGLGTGSLNNLSPHELGLLKLLFESDAGKVNASINFLELANVVSSPGWSKFMKPLEQEMDAHGLLRQSQHRKKWQQALITGLALLTLAMGVAGVFLMRANFWVGLGLFISPIVVAVILSNLSLLSDKGAQEREQWQGFYGGLLALARGQEPLLNPDYLHEFLPYVAAYDLLGKWAKIYKQQAGIRAPTWFHPLSETETLNSFADMLNQIGLIGRTWAQKPPSFAIGRKPTHIG
jgi:hypothetical protein